jgi:hypothetical protein
MSGINYTHHFEFIKAIDILYEKRKDFQVVFCNPSNKVEWSWIKNNVKALKIMKEYPLTRQEYIELLWKGDISVHLYTIERYSGCCLRESIYCNNLIIAPNIYEQAKILGGSYNFYCNNECIPENIANKLNELLDDYNGFYESRIHSEIKERNLNSSYEISCIRVEKDLNKLIS